MIKLIDLLKEGIIQLTSKERDQIESLLPKIIDVITGPKLDSSKYEWVGIIYYEFADKTNGKTEVFVSNDDPKSSGYFQTGDPNNPNDNEIVIMDMY